MAKDKHRKVTPDSGLRATALLTCRAIDIDPEFDALTLRGVFDVIEFPSFPITLPRLEIFFSVFGMTREVEFRIQLGVGANPVAQLQLRADPGQDTGCRLLSATLYDVPFNVPGTYFLILLGPDLALLAKTPLFVRQASTPT
jgi:hypothetical protein